MLWYTSTGYATGWEEGKIVIKHKDWLNTIFHHWNPAHHQQRTHYTGFISFHGFHVWKGLILVGRWAGGQGAAPTHYPEVCPQWAVALRRCRQILNYECWRYCYCLQKKQKKSPNQQSPQKGTRNEKSQRTQLLENFTLSLGAKCGYNKTVQGALHAFNSDPFTQTLIQLFWLYTTHEQIIEPSVWMTTILPA